MGYNGGEGKFKIPRRKYWVWSVETNIIPPKFQSFLGGSCRELPYHLYHWEEL